MNGTKLRFLPPGTAMCCEIIKFRKCEQTFVKTLDTDFLLWYFSTKEVVIMSHIIDADEMPKRPVGRPKDGAQSRTVNVKTRIEPYLDERLTIACNYFGITKSDAIRTGIQMFLKEAEHQMHY